MFFIKLMRENNITFMFKVPNEYRVHEGELGSNDEIGNNGAFVVPYQSFMLRVIASDGMGWEHVSVSCQTVIRTGGRCASSRIYSGTRKI
jgi:hypothetical protein